MSSLRSTLDDLATRFCDDVLAAIRRASLDEIVEGRGGAARRSSPRPGAPRPGRRSPEDVDQTLGLVVAMLKATPDEGMRSEEIQDFLKLDKRLVPRVLKRGLDERVLRTRGQKRATTYFAA